MKLTINLQKIDWWYWAVTFFFIGTALIGWTPGYYMVILVSGVQIIHFWVRLKSIIAFDTQVRIVYFAFTLLGLIKIIRFPFYILMFIATLQVVAFNKCGIALFLKKMPWNKHPVVKIQS